MRRGGGKFCSVACRAAAVGVAGFHQGNRWKGGKRADLDNRYFRSSWEANWARYLNWLKSIGEVQSWFYESKTFEFTRIKRGGRFYTPDFLVINKNGTAEFHEIKGYMDKRSATKLRRMAKYYPEVKLILIDAPMYSSVARKVVGMIPNWERGQLTPKAVLA